MCPRLWKRAKASRFPSTAPGRATFYLVGPDHVVKRSVSLGGDLQIQSSDVRAAGRYQVIVCELISCSLRNVRGEGRAARASELLPSSFASTGLDSVIRLMPPRLCLISTSI